LGCRFVTVRRWLNDVVEFDDDVFQKHVWRYEIVEGFNFGAGRPVEGEAHRSFVGVFAAMDTAITCSIAALALNRLINLKITFLVSFKCGTFSKHALTRNKEQISYITCDVRVIA